MPLTPAQVALCVAIFGAGSASTVAVQKVSKPRPAVSMPKKAGAHAPVQKAAKSAPRPAASRVSIMDCPASQIAVIGSPHGLDANPFAAPQPSAAAGAPPPGTQAPQWPGGGIWIGGGGGVEPRPPVVPGVPDISTWTQAIIGFGLIGLAGRRRKVAA